MDAAADNDFLRIVKDAQTIQFLQVALTILLMYNYVLSLDDEIEYIWKKRISSVSVIYLMLRYFGITYMLYSSVALVTNTISIDKAPTRSYPALSLWFNCLVSAANQIVLQLRLYALYSGSRRVLFLMVPGFVVETIVMIVCITLVTMSIDNAQLDLSVTVSASSNIALKIYIHQVAMMGYECLLFSAALSAALRRYREGLDPLSSNWNQLTRLTDILIEGNVISFLISSVYSVINVVLLLTLKVEWVFGTLNIGFSLGVTIGCHLILQIRRAASPTSLDYDIGEDKSASLWPSIIFPYSSRRFARRR
ncbi:hypothetical protein F5J12DRAFT_302759 [Pisolithus orientalis]|uniref:uncharacterized protein n=1 Tax=Pisolithus orientalis TaxID=936130 RepID=UPI0022258E56|nr:uncharacterized protein F5J12DRAFT_302759 [Pisolithus orientalis]KAI6030663.1 hypothetical protein F5J12DRAFT_302759 [Pisolithus orientalis]